MSTIKGDEPAFPKPLDPYPNTMGTLTTQGHPGMSQRAYMATKIAAGLVAYSGSTGLAYGPGQIATRSCEIADALLAALTEPSHDR